MAGTAREKLVDTLRRWRSGPVGRVAIAMGVLSLLAIIVASFVTVMRRGMGLGRTGSKPSMVCPARAPSSGDRCWRPGLICEFERVGWEPGCSLLMACSPEMAWAEYADADEPSSCGVRNAGVAASCAPTYAAVPRGAACSAPTVCDYPEGRCACSAACPGARAAGKGGAWACDDPAPECPRPRPTIGTGCTETGQRCSYEMCCSGAELECRDGAWWALLVNLACEDAK